MKRIIIAAFLLITVPAFAQTYTPASTPGSNQAAMNIQVIRTDNGTTSHFKVSLTVPPMPPDNKNFTAYRRVFFYGWIGMGDQQLMVATPSCMFKHATCHAGFPITTGLWSVGDKITLEIDLPKPFTDADGAHLHFGIGDISYWPSPNLLPIPR